MGRDPYAPLFSKPPARVPAMCRCGYPAPSRYILNKHIQKWAPGEPGKHGGE